MNTSRTTLLTAFLLLPVLTYAQSEAYYNDSLQSAVALADIKIRQRPAQPATGRGYWRVHTEAGVRSTFVRFYDATDRLLYEEIMPHQYVRLTEHNMARLDAILDRLVGGNLVASAVKSDVMSEAPTETELNTREEAARLAALPTSTNKKGYAIMASGYYQTRLERLLLTLANPDRHRIEVFLWYGQQRKEVFYAIDNGPDYQRKLDLSELPIGHYTLVIRTVDKNFQYTRPFEIRR